VKRAELRARYVAALGEVRIIDDRDGKR